MTTRDWNKDLQDAIREFEHPRRHGLLARILGGIYALYLVVRYG